MAETSRFWNQPAEYTAQQFAKFFEPLLKSGVYAASGIMGLKVTVSGMTATVAAGEGLMRGYHYENDGSPALTFVLSAAPTVAGVDRIDRIALRLDTVAETIVAVVKQGTESSSPQPPILDSSATVLEMPLAQIRVKANANTGTVTDERTPVSLIVSVPNFETEWDNYLDGKDGDYDAWESSLEQRIDSITEISLQNGINTNANNIAGLVGDVSALQTDKMENNRITLSTSDAVLNQMQDGDIWIKYE